MAKRDPLQCASLNGTSNLPVAAQRPQKTLTGTVPQGVPTRAFCVRPCVRTLPSLPTRGVSSATFCRH